jgi:hypothetical protein
MGPGCRGSLSAGFVGTADRSLGIRGGRGTGPLTNTMSICLSYSSIGQSTPPHANSVRPTT